MLVAVVALLAIHVIFAVRGILQRSVTSDETAHLTAGYAYWTLDDFRLQPENGNLPQRWGALPLLLQKPRLVPDDQPREWTKSNAWDIAQAFLFESGNNTEYLLLTARCTMLFWSIASALIVFFWARSMWGDRAGVGALAFYVVSPTTLAHAPLVTSDTAAGACLLLALAAWWWMCQSPGIVRGAVAGAAVGLAFMAKFSAVFLIPAVAVQTLLVLFASRSRWRATLYQVVTASLTAVAASVAVIWIFYGLRYAAANPRLPEFRQFYVPWNELNASGGLVVTAVELFRHGHALPEALLYGVSFVRYFAAGRGAFVAGEYSTTGWWWFFPFAFLVKSTLGELIATTGVVSISLLRRKRGRIDPVRLARSKATPLLIFAVVFGLFSITSHLNIGQRHILPLYLVLFICTGRFFALGAPRWMVATGMAAVLLSAGEMVQNSPNHLAFFNRAAGGPENGWRLLVDSSLDWGQDVEPLAQWVRQHRQPHEKLYVSWFGTADPEYEGLQGNALSPFYTMGRPRKWFELEPGLYCLSATMLQDVYGLQPGPWTPRLERDFQLLQAAAKINFADGTWDRSIERSGFHPEHPAWLLDRLRFSRLCQYLKVRKPDAVINHTQFVFRLTPEEIDTFSNRPYSALVAMMEKSARAAK